MKKCEKCNKEFEPKVEYAKLCMPCWSEQKGITQKVFDQAESVKEETVRNMPAKDETMIRMGAIKDALAYLELECVTQQRKTLTKEDMYVLAEEIRQWIISGKK